MKKLETLISNWERLAANKFADAKYEKDAMGRRLIEHGAICYFNCAQQLRDLMRNDQYTAKGWMPVINGQEHPELYETKSLALARAEEIAAFLFQSGATEVSIDAVYKEGSIPMSEIRKYIEP